MDAKIVSLHDIEAAAAKVLPRNALDYFRSGAEDMVTLKDNREAFKRFTVRQNIIYVLIKVLQTILVAFTGIGLIQG